MPVTLPRIAGAPVEEILKGIREKFNRFQTLLENNSRTLKLISDLEDKLHGQARFDVDYIRRSVQELRHNIGNIIDNLAAIGRDEYRRLEERLATVCSYIDSDFAIYNSAVEDDFIIPLERLDRSRAVSVGSKSAQLGELKSKIGLPVPEGFAISGWAYQHFIDSGDLSERIKALLKKVDIQRGEDLKAISAQIRSLITSAQVPADFAGMLRNAYSDLVQRIGHPRIALRSSAVGEDTRYSFAGQYATFLNVPSADIIDRYRAVLAGKFTPQAIYYALSQQPVESDFPMGVTCLEMVDAAAAGVVYTQHPVDSGNPNMVISAVFGLGKHLVEGRLTPDVFLLAREDGCILSSNIVRKPSMLVMHPEGGTQEVAVPAGNQLLPAVSEDELIQLYRYARRIEAHYNTPRDIEFAIDRQGRIFLLQCRPLLVLSAAPTASAAVDLHSQALARGSPVCPGVGSGPIHHWTPEQDIAALPQGCVLAIRHPFPGIITALGRISALVAEVGGIASHMATLTREYHIPTLVGVSGLSELRSGRCVTVDADNSIIYDGVVEAILKPSRPPQASPASELSLTMLQSIMPHIAPLNLLHPADPNFKAENCQTLHDITRFAHQKAMSEMFASAYKMGKKWKICYRLKSDIPLLVDVIFLDRQPPRRGKRAIITETQINSPMLTAFWAGMREEGFPAKLSTGSQVVPPLAIGHPELHYSELEAEYSTKCHTILSREYMFLSLRMGYHFTTLEALCTAERGKNYIRFQYKGGGAAIDRRTARIKLLAGILLDLGFENRSQGDFLDALYAYHDCQESIGLLKTLGRLILLTKQLDMALSGEAITLWYQDYFRRRLGIS